MIGVLKRCLRIMHRFTDNEFELHLLNFGPLPPDPFIKDIVNNINCHNIGYKDVRNELADLYDLVKPSAIILGEAPLSGYFLDAYIVAACKGIKQIGIENYYGDFNTANCFSSWPNINGWLFLGIKDKFSYGRFLPNCFLAPPLVKPLPLSGNKQNRRITILGYDLEVARFGLNVLDSLSIEIEADLIVGDIVKTKLDLNITEKNIPLTALPDEHTYFNFLFGSRLVICKNGVQQIMESLVANSPVVCLSRPNGVPVTLIPEHLLNYIFYFDMDAPKWHEVSSFVNKMLAHEIKTPWFNEIMKVKDPVEFATNGLRLLLNK